MTTDPEHHTGEEIFFTSKAVSRYTLESDGLAWVVDNLLPDVAIGPSAVRTGTRVTLEVVPGQVPALKDVFRRYTDPDTLRFDRTRTTVKLAKPGTGLISRSEARCVVDGLERFTEVTLDFQGVDLVGQGFCDEVFRVFARAHPGIALVPVNMRDPVAFMVRRARALA